ncbi:hemolysin family protein [Dasania sp. GY-MA-18]|uniref:Hemolysin family protein n=1 Tax=Dasania phycosphaerae TaxID=2950436 RepID=A0A9J6RK35_9GAMM|nr:MULTISPECIES: hemolysin family protein [Dasania]MCR8922164.1 hemolysin family protein [Dasania sp. GY-MA-18]MCZ0864592.1 hemolysin family protein [Dasania phycosphaerae]MCZ0868320.1 hemolysin family protein [Dasania phycosphaerae]
MLLLITYILVAIIFSFACSIFEAVLLSVNRAHIALMKTQGHKAAGSLLKELKDDISKPLSAILSLNTIAHTIGAMGAGAQATVVFGSAYVGVASVILTLLILIFSEIIPKTLGATYWRQLAPVTAYSLKYLIILLYPLVQLSAKITANIPNEPSLNGFSRKEFAAMAEISSQDGQLAKQESKFLKNLMKLRSTLVKHAMTPRTVIFSLPQQMTVEEFFHKHDKEPFTRIPVYADSREDITGYVFRSDLFLAQARGNGDSLLANYRRDLPALLPTMSLSHALNEMLESRVHLLMVVSEYGGVEGIISLEDVLETMLGLEIIDEKDRAIDMQKEALRQWRRREQQKNIDEASTDE